MKKRIFVAINISNEARDKTSKYIEKLRREFPSLRIGWDKPEKLHLTLKFLGEIDERQLNDLTGAVARIAKQFSNASLQIAGTGVFPSKRNARILWLGVREIKGSLQNLNEILENECEKAGFAKEKRSFKAHLTIARLREPANSKELIERHLTESFESGAFEVSELVIYESKLQKSGSIYSIVSKHKFKENESTDKHR